ncbi:hypothetical protein QBC47DRAFT_377666 [Echria macrotheca]|uniref:Secreted protein n=1 Tax=Echria macrotheca TaxID=438768 RepID=A0AAJ0BF18_9PEZI|nr:hypothetical protein QBC47DRAFT_377666 [Echria macrotheca]
MLPCLFVAAFKMLPLSMSVIDAQQVHPHTHSEPEIARIGVQDAATGVRSGSSGLPTWLPVCLPICSACNFEAGLGPGAPG